MNVGTKSLLFGVHQFLWHPITVYRAWVELYKTRPTWREIICIIIHDWGYWGSPNMDGEEGNRHPIVGAKIARWLFGHEYYDLVILHSRHYCREIGQDPSRLCWADKLSAQYDPPWFYMLRGRLSGEIKEFRQKAAEGGFVPLEADDWTWYWWVREQLLELARTMRPDSVPYMPNGKMKSKGA